MAEQLTTMDQALARAVNQFEQLIDELTEAMSTRKPQRAPMSRNSDQYEAESEESYFVSMYRHNGRHGFLSL